MLTKSTGYDEELTRLAIVAYRSYAEATALSPLTGSSALEWQNLSIKEQEAWQKVVLSLSKEFQYI